MSWTGIMTRKQNYLPFMALSPVTILVTMSQLNYLILGFNKNLDRKLKKICTQQMY
jgi:hypothetical protein